MTAPATNTNAGAGPAGKPRMLLITARYAHHGAHSGLAPLLPILERDFTVDIARPGRADKLELARGQLGRLLPRLLGQTPSQTRWSPYYTPGATGRTWEEAVGVFDNNKTSAMIFQGTDQVGPQVSKAGLADLDFFPFPQIVSEYPTDSAIDAPIDGFLMSAKVKNRKGAAAFMEYLGTAAAEQTYLESDPSDIGTATDYPTNTYTALQKKSVDIIKNTKNLAQFLDRDTLPSFAYPDVQNAMNSFLNDPSSYSSICSTLQRQAKAAFA